MSSTIIIDIAKLQRLTIERNKENTFNLLFESIKELVSNCRGYYTYQEEKSWSNEITGSKIKSIKIVIED